MWTIIDKQDFPEYLQKHNLEEYTTEIVLNETPKHLFLPRLFYQNYPGKVKLVRANSQPKSVSFHFQGELRDYQHQIVDRLLTLHHQKGYLNGIVKCPPGTGKTVMAVYLATALKTKTCIVIDNSNLLRQWIDAFLKFTDLVEDDIGIIRRDQLDLNKPVSIAMVQTLLSRFRRDPQGTFTAFVQAGFGLVIYDEVHSTSAAPKYAKASLLFQAPNIVGLSATPFHTGVQDILMRNTIGEILVEDKFYQLVPRYSIVFYQSNLPHNQWKRLNRITDVIKRKTVYNSLLVLSQNYRQLVVNLARNLHDAGHVTLILVVTRKQVQILAQDLQNAGLNPRRFYGGEPDVLSPDEKIIVATYSYCGKGFDFDRLSALILASPLWGRKSLIQVIGRVLRLRPGKKPPVVYDLADATFETRQQIDRKKSIICKEFSCQIEEMWDEAAA